MHTKRRKLEKVETRAESPEYLGRLDKIIDWESLRPVIETTLYPMIEGEEYRKQGGRPYKDVVMMFKILILAKLTAKTIEGIALALAHIAYMRKFVGIGMPTTRTIPHWNTIYKFCRNLTKSNLAEKIFHTSLAEIDKVTKQIMDREENKDRKFCKRMIIDSCIIETQRPNFTDVEYQMIKSGILPIWMNRNNLPYYDINARYTKKRETSYFGYKNHILVDAETKIIRQHITTSAEVHDKNIFLNFLYPYTEQEYSIYADSAYAAVEHKKELRRQKIGYKILKRAYKNRPLSTNDKEDNKLMSQTRAKVEHAFGFMHNSLHKTVFRAKSTAYINVELMLLNLTYNSCRLEQLLRLGINN